MTLFPVVIEGGQIRPMVPFAMTWHCPRCDREERGEGLALADTGAGMSVLPESALPPHIRFDDLPGGEEIRWIRGRLEARIWEATVTVLGVPIADRWKVYRGSRPDFALFGTDTLFRFMRVTFDLGAAEPFFDVTPIPRASMAPVPIERLPLVAYEDSTYRMVGPGSTYGSTAGAALTTPADALRLTAPAMLPEPQRPVLAAPEPNRAQRRAQRAGR